ncbi:MAG: nucleotidyltransferase family protein [Thermodesulfobacteriota bacterium]
MTNNVMTTFLELCDPRRDTLAASASEQDWHSISQLSKLHGVTSFFYHRVKSLGISLPESLNKDWLGIYLYQIAQEQKARRQIKEISDALTPEGIPMILLKGVSSMLRLYPGPGLRTFVDLDILIPADMETKFRKAMRMAGYKPLAARNSPEDEELQKFDGHLDPLWKEEGCMIEPHLSVLGIGGEHLVVLPEIWQEKEETNIDGMKIDHLNKEQFILHTLLHFSRHLSDEGFAEIKWFIDLLYAIRTWEINWSKVWNIAQKWGVDKDILPAMATLNHFWQADIPLIEKAKPIDLKTLVLGVEDRQKQYYANLPKSYMRRFWQMRKLPDIASQIRYLFHLFFPARENLRWRYNLSSKWSIIPYYFIHLLLTWKKFLTGVWYQSASYIFTKDL